MTVYMLDTNVFNLVADGLLPLSALHGKACIATHVQRDELGRTKNPDRLNALNLVFETVLPKVVPTETSVWNDSNWGQGWAKSDTLYNDMLQMLISLDRKSGKPVRPYTQSRDIRIAETALRNQYTLVTEDKNLRTVMLQFGGIAIRAAELADDAALNQNSPTT